MCFHRSGNRGSGFFFFFHRTHALLQVKDLTFWREKNRNVEYYGNLPEPTLSSRFFKSLSFTPLRRPLPRCQTARQRGGSGGIGPTTSPPSGWPRGGYAGESSSAWLPASLRLSRSSPAIPSAASPAALHCPSEERTNMPLRNSLG